MNYGIFQEAVIASLHLKLSLCLPWDHAATAEGRKWATTAALVVTLLHAVAQPPQAQIQQDVRVSPCTSHDKGWF